VALGLRSALAAAYPTVRQLVGADWFDACAARFVDRHLPRDGVLAGYGAGFAAFLADFEPARVLPYLPDVARLDRAWTEAHLAADAPVLRPHGLAGYTANDLLELRLVPHPAARWLSCATSAYTIWRRHREAESLDAPVVARSEPCLVCRPELDVRWCAIDAAGLVLLDRCAAGGSLGHALEEIGDDAAVAWPALVTAGAFTSITEPS
jgi:hypothetical protein